MREWTQLMDAVIIGKSFLAKGGQNPVEAIAMHIPVITGPDMTNFADLVTLLQQAGGIRTCEATKLTATLRALLEDKTATARQCAAAFDTLSLHSGATRRSVELVETLYRTKNTIYTR